MFSVRFFVQTTNIHGITLEIRLARPTHFFLHTYINIYRRQTQAGSIKEFKFDSPLSSFLCIYYYFFYFFAGNTYVYRASKQKFFT